MWPLQSPVQPLGARSMVPAFRHPSPHAMSQPVPASVPVMSFLMYKPQSLGHMLQPPGTQKGLDSLMQEQLLARSLAGHPLPAKEPEVKKADGLLVPQPVYRNPSYFLPHTMAPALAPPVKSLQQREGEACQALPPVPGTLHPSKPRETGPCSDPNLLPLPSSLALPTKEQVGSPIASAHNCLVTYDKCSSSPSTLFLEPPVQSQRKVPEVPSLNLDPWPKLRPPDPGLANWERPPICYPSTKYPQSPYSLALHYPFLMLQAPRCYFPNLFDTCVPRAAGAGVVASPPTQPMVVPRDAEPPRHAGHPGFALSPEDASMFHTSCARMEPGCEQHQAESPQWQRSSRHSSAFQPVCTSKKLSRGSSWFTEMFPEEEGGWKKPSQEEQKAPFPERKITSPAPQDTCHGAPVSFVIRGQGDACKVKDEAEELIPPSPAMTPLKELEDLRDTKVIPSSPPMPVIHDVFSLAPQLDVTEASDHIIYCREHLWGDCLPQNSGSNHVSVIKKQSVVRTGSDARQSPRGSEMVPKQPKPVPQPVESQCDNPLGIYTQEGSPGSVGSGELTPEDMVLDFSLKKSVVEAEETQGPIGHAEMPAGEHVEEREKEGAEGKVVVGEDAQLQLFNMGFGDKSNFESSINLMFKKYKLLSSVTFGSKASEQDGGHCGLQLSPPSSTPTLTPPTSPPASQVMPPPGPQPSFTALQGDPPAAPGTLGEEWDGQSWDCPPKTLCSTYFTSLHTCICDRISNSVYHCSPELLQQWLKKADPVEEPGETLKSLAKAKKNFRTCGPQKLTKDKEIWLAFEDVSHLLTKLLHQLKSFMLSCPFPHVVRAGTIFIPIHLVKNQLFPMLPRASIDQVLQKHKVELRPTTLSEERRLRSMKLQGCSSRMLKLLALKQFPEIYTDLLNLHWLNSIHQHLDRFEVRAYKHTCNPGMVTQRDDGRVTATKSKKIRH